ncbi:MAG TPA: hypothetical protein PLZ42_03035 [Methanothrix sp.]|mgnify:CR=1 FL=1|nr:hypothetical protein [Methanothrix sp.]
MVRAILLVALLLHPGLGQAPDLEWERVLGGAADDGGLTLRKTGDSGLIVAGYTASRGAGGRDLWLIKTDPEGELEWERTFGGPGDEEGWTVLETESGYVVAGVAEAGAGSPVAGGKDLFLVRTYSDGYERWRRSFGGAADDWGVSMVETEDGFVIVGLTCSFGSGGSDGWILKTDSDGNEEWNLAIGGSKNDGLASILESEDGYVVAGTTESYGAGGKDLWLARVDPDGNRIWEKTFGGEGDERGNQVLDAGDGYLLVGVSDPAGSANRDLLLVKTDLEGEKIWEETIGSIGEEGGWSARTTSDGGYVILGYSNRSTDQNIWLVKVGEDGEEAWEETFGGWGRDLGRSIVSTEDGGWAMTGWTESEGSGMDLWLGKTEGTGSAGGAT